MEYKVLKDFIDRNGKLRKPNTIIEMDSINAEKYLKSKKIKLINNSNVTTKQNNDKEINQRTEQKAKQSAEQKVKQKVATVGQKVKR